MSESKYPIDEFLPAEAGEISYVVVDENGKEIEIIKGQPKESHE